VEQEILPQQVQLKELMEEYHLVAWLNVEVLVAVVEQLQLVQMDLLVKLVLVVLVHQIQF
tara:strand:+ start:208 stop:387 length:180 start_codon:yes stop_codon:yes gene_type:complete